MEDHREESGIVLGLELETGFRSEEDSVQINLFNLNFQFCVCTKKFYV